ncbi:hypothetical protein QTO34_018329 [Cnephaeus nilssonii]|uniref:Uncharacterized protein n=1 Tax=Cnephaeus nilssonii TaxID=3371016 RepID=A0AA40HYP6_CNENI|nr:hypothetical protein QTO34_018329 [Eptesicus nilssonii]
MEEVKISTLTSVWKKFILTLMNDFEWFSTSVVAVTADVVEIASKVELEVEPENVTELLQFYDKTLMDVVKIFEITARKLEYYINLINKAAPRLRGLTNIGKSSTVSKMLSNRITIYRKIVPERKSHHHPDQSAAVNIEERPSASKKIITSEGSDDVKRAAPGDPSKYLGEPSAAPERAPLSIWASPEQCLPWPWVRLPEVLTTPARAQHAT